MKRTAWLCSGARLQWPSLSEIVALLLDSWVGLGWIWTSRMQISGYTSLSYFIIEISPRVLVSVSRSHWAYAHPTPPRRAPFPVFYLDVSYIFAMAIRCFASVFRRMLQVFWMYVASVLSRCCKSRFGVAHVTTI
jgi:hypothetical protein